MSLIDEYTKTGELPVFSQDLIELLDQLYPEKSPTRKDAEANEKLLWMDAGRRELIRDLKVKLNDREE